MSRNECKLAKGIVFAHLHSIRLLWSTAFDPGLNKKISFDIPVTRGADCESSSLGRHIYCAWLASRWPITRTTWTCVVRRAGNFAARANEVQSELMKRLQQCRSFLPLQVGCKVVAALLHYFLLAMFSWMLCQGILFYIQIIQVFGSDPKGVLKYFYAFGWGTFVGMTNFTWLSIPFRMLKANVRCVLSFLLNFIECLVPLKTHSVSVKARLHMRFLMRFLMRFRVQNAPYPTLHHCFFSRSIAWIGKKVITFYLKTPFFPMSAHLAVFCRSATRLKTRAG